MARHNCPWDGKTCYYAAISENMDALKWARSEGCPWNRQTFDAAVRNGNIDLLEYCLKNGCPRIGDACTTAMENRDDLKALETLKWLRQHSFPWDEWTCIKAL